eukprot:COSAG01_NODE_747_length_13858_cov_8.394869_9_plen_135_part_00
MSSSPHSCTGTNTQTAIDTKACTHVIDLVATLPPKHAAVVATEASVDRIDRDSDGLPHQNGYLSSRGGNQNRWHSLVSCDHGESTTSRFGLTCRSTAAMSCRSLRCGTFLAAAIAATWRPAFRPSQRPFLAVYL